MRNMTEADLTDVVLARYAGTPDPRLREILASLIRHLHAFARDVRLTEAEWMEGIQYLTRTGQKCDAKRQEMILLSDNLGLSALVNMVSAGVGEGATENTVVGPFYVPGSPERKTGESLLLRERSEPELIVHGRISGPDGEAVPNAKIEVWQTDSNGMYDIQDSEQPEDNLRGWYRSDADGRFQINTIRPTSYPIPTDGPVGELLRATDRHPWRPAHLHATITADGYQTLTTHLFDAADEYLDSDVVFAVKESLIRTIKQNDQAGDADALGTAAPFWELKTDFALQRAA
jgi:protocatechuate 3,4-dioxygenase beta subunit